MKIFMIVDDSPVIRKVARRILESMGYVVAEAVDGIDALEKCSQNMPDAIIFDWDMPRMDGVEFISEAELARKTRIELAFNQIVEQVEHATREDKS